MFDLRVGRGQKNGKPTRAGGLSRGENSFQACARLASKLFILRPESRGARREKSSRETVENAGLQLQLYQ
jgi:hypothetical protein